MFGVFFLLKTTILTIVNKLINKYKHVSKTLNTLLITVKDTKNKRVIR
jgi:hypothetical protein